MKKIIIAMAAVAAAFTTASCNKEQPVSANENPTVGKSVITASIENGLTKAHLDANGDDTDGYKVFWSEGDDLIVGGGLDEYGNYLNWVAEYKLEDSSAGSSKGTFSWQAGNTFISIDEICQEPSFEAGNMYMAVHPFDLIDMNTSAFTWRTEQTYNGTTGYIPMIAAAEGTEDGTADFKFTNLGGLLRLTVKGTATIKSITVKAKEPMSGEIDCFAMDEEGNIVALMGNDDRYETYNYINLDCGESGVALSSTGTDFYISMPCHYSVPGDDISLGGYSEVTITLTDMKDNICEKKLSSNKQLVIERSKITPATFTTSEFKSPVPEGALPGKFSVSADKQVYFSKGNLWYDNSTEPDGPRFKIEYNQYDYKVAIQHSDSDGISYWDWDKNHISHFYWSKNTYTAYAQTYTEMGSTDDVFFSNETPTTASPDFTVNVDEEGQTGVWRVLSGGPDGEWQYLLEERKMKYGKARYTNRTSGQRIAMTIYYGLFIYPDDYNGAEIGKGGPETWEGIDAAGIVFLPATGARGGDNPGDRVYFVNDHYGAYWSGTPHPDNQSKAYCLCFSTYPYFYVSSIDFRGDGISVRLVRDVK